MKISRSKIEALLAEYGWTKTVYSEKCGISRQNISTIVLRGSCEPRTAGKLAAGLGVSVSEIIDENQHST